MGSPRRRQRAAVRAGRRSREGGFTLLELLMTLGVTTIGLIGLLSLHLSIVRSNDGASRTAEATQIAHATLESLRQARTTDDLTMLLVGLPSPPPIDVPFCRRNGNAVEATTVGRNGMTYRCRVVVLALPTAASTIWRIRVEIGWTDDGAAQGAQGGILDHLIAVEMLRTPEEAL
jgi:type II secretory pathway pseudopilin PulG